MALGLRGRAAAARYGVAARSPGCCAQGLGRSQACSLSVDLGAAAAAGGADTRVRLPRRAARRSGAGAARWTSGCGAERPRRGTGSRPDRRAVAHIGWGADVHSIR